MEQLTLKINDILDNCFETEEAKNTYLKWIEQYKIKFKKDFFFDKLNNESFDNIDIIENEDGFWLKINENMFLNQVYRDLNINKSIIINDINNLNVMLRLNELSKITKLEELKTEFPNIYKNYIEALKMSSSIQALNDAQFITVLTMEDCYERAIKIKEEMFSYGFSSNFKYFINNQYLLYFYMLKNKDSFFNYVNNTMLNIKNIRGFNKNKFQLCLLNKYIKTSEKSDNYDRINEYFPKITQLIKKISMDCKNTDELNIIIDGKNITFNELIEKYRDLCSTDLQSIVYKDGSTMEVIDNKIIDKNDNKTNFYNKTGFITTSEGVLENGMIYNAYFYENGKVIVEVSSNDKEETYIFDIEKLVSLKEENKRSSMQEKKDRMIIASGDSLEKVLTKAINKTITKEHSEKVKKILYKIHKKNS